jgi:2,3-diaminopropionate biosynthesis protein SbnB
MHSNDILVLRGHEVLTLLTGREDELMDAVGAAYVAHAKGKSSLPHSTFLHFPDAERNRIIALPSYLGDSFDVAGLKWIASFPGNYDLGLDRASAVMIMNSAQTGFPTAIMEGSIISAKRTAASAALAARTVHGCEQVDVVGLIGCGLINFEIARFLRAACPEASALLVYDVDQSRARQFKEKCGEIASGLEVTVATELEMVLRQASIVSFATTAIAPHISDLGGCPPGSTILHVSLRDLKPEVILACDNVVDDISHVSRALTSIHLTEQLCGNSDFIRCTLADILMGIAPARIDAARTVVFSPFGLGVLDLVVGKFVYERALKEKLGTVIDSFLPAPWTQKWKIESAA